MPLWPSFRDRTGRRRIPRRLAPPISSSWSSSIPRIKLDIRYAGANNFLGKPVYKEARAFLQRPAAEGLLAAHKELAKDGYGLMIHDGYRPWAITKLFWDMTSGFQREFVADPKTGSKHNRGCAVDLTMYDLATGQVVEMPGGYDEMSRRSYPDYPGGPPEARARRDLLRKVMESHGFTVEPNEWWHFNYQDWTALPDPRYCVREIE